ncbi:MAG: acyltransferase [Myxococcales bacterium]|nr:acyltransferase [Myxococcales bacterium]
MRVGRGIELIAPENIHLGDDVTLFGNTVLNAFGSRGSIRIGDSTHIDHFGVLYGQGGLTIGRKCAIASRVTIYSQSNQYRGSPETPIIEQPVQYDPVSIGDDVWIGAGAVILPGARIGDHCVVAAGAVVRGGEVPAWSIVAGMPGKVIGNRRAAK